MARPNEAITRPADAPWPVEKGHAYVQVDRRLFRFVATWKKQVGDFVKEGDTLCKVRLRNELFSAKLECQVTGTLIKIYDPPWSIEALNATIIAYFKLSDKPDPQLSRRLRAGLGPRAGVFLCYRRSDTDDATSRLYDWLAKDYGSDSVFIDVETIPLGVDFVNWVNEKLTQCCAIIVIIGRDWLSAKDGGGRRRLEFPDDHVRVEIRTALGLGIAVIPVLVQNATLPTAADLPNDIAALARRNALALRHGRWPDDMPRLIKELGRLRETTVG